MPAGTYNFEIEQGTTFTRDFTWKDSAGVAINITDYSIRMQARNSLDDSSTLFSLGTATPLSGITITGAAAGQFRVSMAATQTAALNFSTAIYDLEMVSAAGAVTRLLEGKITLLREVTR